MLTIETIAQRIHWVRGHKIMLDADLASLYNVQTRALVQAVKRNERRFPQDFMFQLTEDEWTALRSQSVTSNGRGGRRYAPYAFTEHGALMLSSVLNSETAAEIGIMNTNLNPSQPPLISGGATRYHSPLMPRRKSSWGTRGAGGLALPTLNAPNLPTKSTQQSDSTTTQQHALPSEAPHRHEIPAQPNPATFCRPRTNSGVNERVTTVLDHGQRHPGQRTCPVLGRKSPQHRISAMTNTRLKQTSDFEHSPPGIIHELTLEKQATSRSVNMSSNERRITP